MQGKAIAWTNPKIGLTRSNGLHSRVFYCLKNVPPICAMSSGLIAILSLDLVNASSQPIQKSSLYNNRITQSFTTILTATLTTPQPTLHDISETTCWKNSVTLWQRLKTHRGFRKGNTFDPITKPKPIRQEHKISNARRNNSNLEPWARPDLHPPELQNRQSYQERATSLASSSRFKQGLDHTELTQQYFRTRRLPGSQHSLT